MKKYAQPSPLYPVSVVAKKLGKSARTISTLAKKKAGFPQPIRHNGKIVGWIPKEIDKWLLKQ